MTKVNGRRKREGGLHAGVRLQTGCENGWVRCVSMRDAWTGMATKEKLRSSERNVYLYPWLGHCLLCLYYNWLLVITPGVIESALTTFHVEIVVWMLRWMWFDTWYSDVISWRASRCKGVWCWCLTYWQTYIHLDGRRASQL